jgi:membrane-associated phospholipid phosphatase
VSGPRVRYTKILVVAYVVWFACFWSVGTIAAKLPTRDITSSWDVAIPVVPAFVWPYELCYALPFIAIFVIRDWRRFDAALVAIGLASTTAFIVYLCVPIAFARPVLGDGLSERVLAMEYAADFSPGANKLPSMHVALSWIMGLAMLRQRGWLADGVVIVVVLAITASTLFVKQHLIADVAAGIVWGIAAWWLARQLAAHRARVAT